MGAAEMSSGRADERCHTHGGTTCGRCIHRWCISAWRKDYSAAGITIPPRSDSEYFVMVGVKVVGPVTQTLKGCILEYRAGVGPTDYGCPKLRGWCTTYRGHYADPAMLVF